jgi:beta-galactosidase
VSYEDLWATAEQPHSPDFSYWSFVASFYRAIRRRGPQVDIVPPTADLHDYAAVVAPTVHLADEAVATHFERYVADGGHLLLGPRTGYKQPDNRLHETLAPGPLRELVGAEVDQHETVPASFETTVTYRGRDYEYRTWAEWLTPGTATTVGEHTAGVAAGEPAIVERHVGTGSVTYCGVWPAADLADTLVVDLLDGSGVAYTDRLPATLRLARRDGYVWVLNFGGDAVAVDAPDDARWLLGSQSVPRYDLAVLDGELTDISVG